MTGENAIALADWSGFIADCRTPGVEALDPWERSARSRRLAAEQRELDRDLSGRAAGGIGSVIPTA